MYLGTERGIIVGKGFYELVVGIDYVVVFNKNESDAAYTGAVLVGCFKV